MRAPASRLSRLEAEFWGFRRRKRFRFRFLQGRHRSSASLLYMLIVEPVMAVIAIGFFAPSLLIVSPSFKKKVNAAGEERDNRVRASLGTMCSKRRRNNIEKVRIPERKNIYGIRIRIFLLTKYFMNIPEPKPDSAILGTVKASLMSAGFAGNSRAPNEIGNPSSPSSQDIEPNDHPGA